MSLNLEKFVTGIIDFFGIILPGAILTFFFYGQFYSFLFGAGKPFPEISRDHELVAFMIVAYITGHFINALGANFLDDRYDSHTRKKFIRNFDLTFLAAKAIKDKYLAHKDLKTQIFNDDQILKENYLLSYAGKLKDNIDHSEDDRRILSLLGNEKKMKEFLKEFTTRKSEIIDDQKKEDQENEKLLQTLCKSFIENTRIEIINTYKFSKRILLIKNPQALEEVNRLEADQKFFRGLVIAFLFMAAILFIKTVISFIIEGIGSFSDYVNLLIPVLFLFLSWRSYEIYSKLRFKNTELAYHFIISMKIEPEKENDKTKLT